MLEMLGVDGSGLFSLREGALQALGTHVGPWGYSFRRSLLPGGIPVASCLSRGLSKKASESDPRCFQITASALGFGACKILHILFKRGVSVSYSQLTLLNISPTGYQDQMFWGIIFPM